MTVLSTIQDLAPSIGIAVPTAVFSETSRTAVELKACVKEARAALLEAHDWQVLKTVDATTIAGDGSTTGFDLPSDFARMALDTRLYSTAEPTLPYVQIGDVDEWLALDIQDFDTVQKRWIIYGGQFHFAPAPESGATVKFTYISNKIVAPDAGVPKAEFTADTDSLRIDERLLRLAMKWKWRADKGLPYAEDMENLEEALEKLRGRESGPRQVRIGQARTGFSGDLAFPRVLGS